MFFITYSPLTITTGRQLRLVRVNDPENLRFDTSPPRAVAIYLWLLIPIIKLAPCL